MARKKTPKTDGANEAVSKVETGLNVAAEKPQTGAGAVTETSSGATKAERTSRTPRNPAARLEAVKTEPRNNVVPINLEDEIRKLAYLLSERRGFVPGHESEDWLAAESEVLQRYRQQSA